MLDLVEWGKSSVKIKLKPQFQPPLSPPSKSIHRRRTSKPTSSRFRPSHKTRSRHRRRPSKSWHCTNCKSSDGPAHRTLHAQNFASSIDNSGGAERHPPSTFDVARRRRRVAWRRCKASWPLCGDGWVEGQWVAGSLAVDHVWGGSAWGRWKMGQTSHIVAHFSLSDQSPSCLGTM